MGLAKRGVGLAASTFQAINAVCILIFGLIFTSLWSALGARGLDPSPPVKFALALFQVGLGFAAFWYGATQHDPRGMAGGSWLILGYVLPTTGELWLSPVGLAERPRVSARSVGSKGYLEFYN